MRPVHRVRIAALSATVGLLLTALTPIAAQAAPVDQLPGTKPGWLGHSRQLGDASASAGVHARIYLAPRGGLAAMEAEAMAVSTPGDPRYRKFLTPAQYRQRFAPAELEIRLIRAFANRFGLTVDSVGPDNEYVAVSGDVAQAEQAFAVAIKRFSHDGQTVQAPASALTVPAAISDHILTVTGLDTTKVRIRKAAPEGYRGPSACSTSYGQKTATVGPDGTPIPKYRGKQLPYRLCGYTGTQLRAAYEGSTSLTGAGVSIGIVGAYASPDIAADAATYARKHGDAPYRSGQLTQTLPSAYTDEDACGGAEQYWGEETLDIEAAHAMAGGAQLHYYGIASCDDADFETTYRRILDDNTVQVVSTSYGDVGEDVGAAELIVTNALFARGALQGISFLASSGDFGDEVIDLGVPEADFFASSPFITAVGGTTAAIDAKNRLVAQTGWGRHIATLSADGSGWEDQGFYDGSGGGVSKYFAKPAYQNGVVGGTMRVEPDVALVGDPTTGFVVGETQTFPDGTYYDENPYGGTSLSSPLFAGMTALSLQAAGQRAGLLNPAVYQQRTSAFTDVLPSFPDPGNVRVLYTNGVDASDGYDYGVATFGQDSSLQTTKGYDEVTGVGTPNSRWLTALR